MQRLSAMVLHRASRPLPHQKVPPDLRQAQAGVIMLEYGRHNELVPCPNPNCSLRTLFAKRGKKVQVCICAGCGAALEYPPKAPVQPTLL